MLVSDYIVSFLIDKGITDVFGYPGGMVTYLMDSFAKKKDLIKTHVCYHEQGASFNACGYAQVAGLPGVAYATSGPGATNLVTGIANAYFDSLPCIFVTGQVNTYESKGTLEVRQKGFQETDIVSIVKTITKYAVQITDPMKIKMELEKAFYLSMEGRRGPVLLDIPMDVQRSQIDEGLLDGFNYDQNISGCKAYDDAAYILRELGSAKQPLIIAGAGIKNSGMKDVFRKVVDKLQLPVVTSMIGVDCLESTSENKIGFIGAYGHRAANFATGKSDLIISLGSRLDCRQTGSNKDVFAQHAKIIRVDIDAGETTNKIKDNEKCLVCNLAKLLPDILELPYENNIAHMEWLKKCNFMKTALQTIDGEPENIVVKEISRYITEDAVITTDVGQNQVWVAQSFEVKKQQNILFSGGHGAMGYSLPAAIGAYYACRKPIICFTGDGGLQMNIQELQFVVRENIPIKIVLLNNKSLGMIRHFQEMYFDGNYTQTVNEEGYTVPDFCKIAEAYGINAYRITNDFSCLKELFSNNEPVFLDVECGDKTYVFPKLAINRPIYDQEPLIDRELFNKLLHGDF